LTIHGYKTLQKEALVISNGPNHLNTCFSDEHLWSYVEDLHRNSYEVSIIYIDVNQNLSMSAKNQYNFPALSFIEIYGEVERHSNANSG
jgi:hypothetical protein